MNVFKKYIVTLILLAGLIAYVAFTESTGTCPLQYFSYQKQYVMEGMPAPQWELPTTDGNTFKASQLHGKVAIVNFWATWCPNCKEESPHFSKVSHLYKDRPVQFIGICMDQGNPDQVQATAEAWGIEFPVLMGDRHIGALFGGVVNVPTTVVIRPDGIIHAKFEGKLDHVELTGTIEQLLNAPSALSQSYDH